MNIVGKLTLRHLKENKKRTVVTICGVIVSVAMITAVTTSISSFFGMMSEQVECTSGDWIGYYSNVLAEKREQLAADENVAQIITAKDTGNLLVGDAINDTGTNLLSVRAQENGTFDHVKLPLTNGTYPVNENEIAVYRNFLRSNHLDWKVGDTITLTQLQRYNIADEMTPLRQFTPYDPEAQTVRLTGTKEYKLVGIFYGYDFTEYNAVTGLDPSTVQPGDTVDFFITQKRLSMRSGDQAEALVNVLDATSCRVNDDMLRYNGYLLGGEATALYGIGAIVMVLILIASVTLIYNAFAISNNERSRYLGMLASVGATKQQKRSTVYYEGALIGAIGIPLGILAGIGGIGITFYFIGDMISDIYLGMMGQEGGTMRLVVSPGGLLLSVALSILTILISAYIPGRNASRTTPIDALRGTSEVTASAKSLRLSPLSKKLFGCEGQLALKNLKRNQKKYRVIVASLVLSLVLFLGVNSFTGILTKGIALAKSQNPYDIGFSVWGTETQEQQQKIEAYLDTLDGVTDKTFIGQNTVYWLADNSRLHTEGALVSVDDGRTAAGLDLFVLDDSSFRAICKQYGIDARPYFQTEQIRVLMQNWSVQYTGNGKGNVYTEVHPFQGKPGETLEVVADDQIQWTGEEESNGEQERLHIQPDAPTQTLLIQDIIKENMMQNVHDMTSDRPILLLPQSVMQQAGLPFQSENSVVTFGLCTDDPETLDDALAHFIESEGLENVSVYNHALEEKQLRNMLLVVQVFVYGFITLMTLVSVANIFNTIATGMELRRREFAMIKSMGMTPKSFRRMVMCESLFYGIKALAIGLPLSVLIHLAMWAAMHSTFQLDLLGSFQWGAYGVAVLGVAVIVGLALLYSVGKIKKDNIIETLKQEDN